MTFVGDELLAPAGPIESFDKLTVNENEAERPKSNSGNNTTNDSIPTGPAALKNPQRRRKSKSGKPPGPDAVPQKTRRRQRKNGNKSQDTTQKADSPPKSDLVVTNNSSSSEADSGSRPVESRPSTPFSDSIEESRPSTPTTASPQLFKEPQPVHTGLTLRIPKKSMLANGINWLLDRSKVFVAIDLELFEFNNNYLTEIGIAVYDPRGMPKNQPNPILPKIKCCHFIVKENKRKVNGRFVPNNMYNFSYGESVIMAMEDCKTAVNTILGTLAKDNNMVIVGHGVDGDISVLIKEGFCVPKHQVLDTSSMWRMTRKEGFGSLEKLLEFFEIPHALMHNAGNDAFLSLCLYFALCDPEVRREKRLDEPQPQEDIQPSSRSKRGKKMIPSEPPCVSHDEAVKLIINL
jgi:hypothetical protein